MLQSILSASPLFALVFLGFVLSHWAGWPPRISEGLARFVFTLALPAMLFRMMGNLADMPPVDARLLIAFFGGCLIVFAVARLIGYFAFGLDGTQQSVFALGGVFSNNVMLGVPLVKTLIGEQAMPSVALVLVFNALILWTLVTVSVEWARQGTLSLAGFGRTAVAVAKNPIVASIVAGTLFGLTRLPIPELIDRPLDMLGDAAVPLALVALGMGLAEYGVRGRLRLSLTITALKLLLLPSIVWMLAWLLALPPLETQVIVTLSSLAVGVNVYLMARQFDAMEGPVAASLILSTLFCAVTSPLALGLVG